MSGKQNKTKTKQKQNQSVRDRKCGLDSPHRVGSTEIAEHRKAVALRGFPRTHSGMGRVGGSLHLLAGQRRVGDLHKSRARGKLGLDLRQHEPVREHRRNLGFLENEVWEWVLGMVWCKYILFSFLFIPFFFSFLFFFFFFFFFFFVCECVFLAVVYHTLDFSAPGSPMRTCCSD
jgi:hypothetical protein